jgi:hypothetical protein
MSAREPDPAAELAALRALIREAHEATKDLRAAIREARQVAADAARATEAAAFAAGQAELGRWSDHIQGQMDAAAADLNRAVDAARAHIVDALTPVELEVDEATQQLKVRFAGNRFDAGPVEAGPNGR